MISLGLALAYIQTLGEISTGEKWLILHIIHSLDGRPHLWLQSSAEDMGKVLKCSERTLYRHVKNLKKRDVLLVENCKKLYGMVDANKYGLPGWEKFFEKYNKPDASVST
jgi:hypothetical protein